MEQALVFASIVLGVAVASELNNLHKLLQSDKVKWHWAQPAFALLTLISIMSFWWLIAKRDLDAEITLAAFLPVMWVLVLFNLIAAAALPDSIPDKGVDLGEYYQSKRRYLWCLYFLALVPLAGNWILYSARTAPDLAQFVNMTIGEFFGLGLIIWMFFANRWWMVALGYITFSILASAWLFRAI